MAASIARGCRATMALGWSYRCTWALRPAPASVACQALAGQNWRQITGPSEPGAFQPPPKPVIVDKRRPQHRESSILRVTTADPYASGKTSQFLGICIQRSGTGLGATFILRNTIEGQGVEICFELYNPRIQEIQVVKLQKRLDDSLLYLRDALPEYSTFDMNMKPIAQEPSQEVHVNQLKVKMKPKPWSKRWERPKFNIKGIRFDLCLTEEQMKEAQKWSQPWLEFDMMREYDTSKTEAAIWDEIEASKNS
eukprot:XP_028352829.1 39S ribosomal protein L19, mitochondrial isoform X2 [Physeter catodon]